MNEAELMKAAGQEIVYSNVYYGKCLLTLWEGKFPRNEDGKIVGAPVRWIEGDNPKERIIMIDFMLDLCPGCTSNYPVKQNWMKHDRDWNKIVLPSLKELGITTPKGDVDLTQVKDHWAKVQQVEGTRPRDKNNPDKGCWNTWKFLAVYKTEEECLNAMALDNGEVPEEIPAAAAKKESTADKREARRTAALQFVKVSIGMMKGEKPEEIRKATLKFIQTNPNVQPYVTIDEPEIEEMIRDAAAEPPF